MKTPSSVCHFCKGSKKITNPFTFKLVQCPVCHGSGHRRTEGVTVPARPDNEQARAEDAWADRELAEELSQDDPDTLKTLSIKEQQSRSQAETARRVAEMQKQEAVTAEKNLFDLTQKLLEEKKLKVKRKP